MLTKVTVYSQWSNLDPLVLNVVNRPDDDLFEVRNIDGLGDVTAEINTTKLGSIPGESFVGSNVGKRNIVLTLGLSPDWNTWTMSRLRRLLNKYFTSQLRVRMVFETQEFSPVEISGYVESNEPSMFSKDPEHVISVICPDLYFRAVDPTIIEGQTDMDPLEITYEGNVDTGMNVIVLDTFTPGDDPVWAKIQVNDPLENSIYVPDPTLFNENLHYNSVPGDKYIKRINIAGPETSLLNSAIITDDNDRDRQWPRIGPGTIDFAVTSDQLLAWQLTYYDQFASL